jgi:hypothetical protein
MRGPISAIIILAFLGIVIWLTQRRKKIDEAALSQLAQSKGWQYQKSFELPQLGSGNVLRYRFSNSTGEGGEWTLDLESASVSGGPGGAPQQSTTWHTEDVKLPNELILIGPRPEDMPPHLDFGGALSGMVVPMLLGRLLSGGEAPDTTRLREVKGARLERHYLVFATDEALLGRLLNQGTETALMELAGSLKEKQRPAIMFWHRGLQVKCAGLITRPVDLQGIAALGEALKATWSN